jgi:NADH-quinone oxidoreductase subunit N
MVSLNDLLVIMPVIVVAGWGTLLLLADLWIPAEKKSITALLAAAGLIAAMVVTVTQNPAPASGFGGMAIKDGFTVFMYLLFLVSGLVGIALAYDYLKRMQIERGEYYVLLLFSISGMMLMASANDLLVVFLALELLSIPLYVLAGFARPRLESEESSLKYFLLGAFSSTFILYGIAMVYGGTAHTDFTGILAAVSGGSANMVLVLLGAGLLLVGLGFKVGAVPFHMWIPDVYQGSPSPVTGFMTVGTKAAGFAALVRIFVAVFPLIAAEITPVLWVLSAGTMVVGNVLAVAQTNIKRLLAYSSIANAGYILMALVPFGNPEVVKESVASMIFFLLAYALTSLGAWSVVIALEKNEGGGLELEDYAGLGRKYPWIGIAMLVFMLSFTGVPLTMGFWGKLYLFKAAVDGGFVWLALIGLLTSLVSAFYYLRVVVVMFMKNGEPELAPGRWIPIMTGLTAVGVVGLSFFPTPILEWASRALLWVQ